MQNNGIMAATYIIKSLSGEIANRSIRVNYRNIVISGKVHCKEANGWLEFNILLPIGAEPEVFKLKFIGRTSQYRARYYGVRERMNEEISRIIEEWRSQV